MAGANHTITRLASVGADQEKPHSVCNTFESLSAFDPLAFDVERLADRLIFVVVVAGGVLVAEKG